MDNFEDMTLDNQLKVDSIMGFYTRTYYEIELMKMLKKKSKEKFFCMFADFNFLKYANDMYGYTKVDVALKKISLLVLEEVKKAVNDYCIVRFGGDEICIFGNGIDLDMVAKLKEDIQKSIKECCRECLNLSLAIGYSHSDNNNEFEELVAEAKENMKTDKEYLKSESAVNVQKAVEMIAPTIERMVAPKDYEEFIAILEQKLMGEKNK